MNVHTSHIPLFIQTQLKHNELKQIAMPELLMPDEFKAYIKVKIDNQNFNK